MSKGKAKRVQAGKGKKAEAGTPPQPRAPAMTVEEAAKYIGPDMAEEFADLCNSFDTDGKPGIAPASGRRELEADQVVLVLQMPGTFGDCRTAFDVERFLGALLCMVIGLDRKKRKRSQVWVVFLAHDRPHVMGLSLWLGFTENVPAGIVHAVQALVEKQGVRTGLEYGTVRESGLQPFLALTDEGLELPPEDELPLDEILLEDFGHVVRRGFRLV